MNCLVNNKSTLKTDELYERNIICVVSFRSGFNNSDYNFKFSAFLSILA